MIQVPALRNYQQAAKTETQKHMMKGHKALLIVLATGGGKTNIAADMIMNARQRGKRILFLAHRRELITQCRDRLLQFGIIAGVIMGRERYKGDSVNVASVQTLVQRLDELPPVDIIFVDEAHHVALGAPVTKDDVAEALEASDNEAVSALATTAKKKLPAMYRRIFDAYGITDKAEGAPYVIGMTATPQRLDGKPLGDAFEVMIIPQVDGVDVDMSWLQDQGFLVPARYFAGKEKVDLEGLVPSAGTGDFKADELYQRVDEKRLYDDVVAHYQQRAKGMQAVCFNVNVEHSLHMCREFEAAGIKAEHLDGTTPEKLRDAIIGRFKRKETQVLNNVGIITEGVDIPGIECVIMNRPTDSVSLWLQCIGRALRPVYLPAMPDGTQAFDLSTQDGRLGSITWSDKPFAVILDHGTNCLRLGFAEDKREYSLTAKKKKKGKPPVSECPEAYGGCGALLTGFPSVCKMCGFELRTEAEANELASPSGKELVKGEFTEVTPEHLRKYTGDMTLTELTEFRAHKKLHGNWIVHQLRHRAKLQSVTEGGDEHAIFVQLITEYANLETPYKKAFKPGWIHRTLQDFAISQHPIQS
jgi:DNA repair protein RadD